MGYENFSELEGSSSGGQSNTITLSGSELSVNLPDVSFVKDADISRDGMDLVLNGPQGEVIIDGYFAAPDAPTLVAPDGSSLSPQLVNSFVKSNPIYADSGSMSDESPVGAIQEISGDATVTRADGSTENLQLGSPIYQGDIVETSDEGAVNIMFIDETSFAVSEDARLAIDEYVFDPATAEGVTNFSVLKGMFVFTSGMIGREDPDDVHIETPVGSIGIRGTIIAGNVDSGEITVVEGAIVLKNAGGFEITLDEQFETGQFDPAGGEIMNMGIMPANDVNARFQPVAGVAPQLFSSINDVADGQTQETAPDQQQEPTPDLMQEGEALENNETLDANDDGSIDGTVDENNDGSADGTIQEMQNNSDDAVEDEIIDAQSNAEEMLQDASETDETVTQNVADEQLPTTTSFNSDPMADGSGLNQTAGTSGTPNTVDSTRVASTSAPTTTSGGTAAIGSSANLPPPPPTVLGSGTNTTTTTNAAFALNVQTFAVAENDTSGVRVANITGVNGTLDTASFNLGGPAQSFFYFANDGIGGVDVFLNAGEDFNFESMRPYYNVNATAQSIGGEAASSVINFNVQDINEQVENFDQVSDEMFNASEGTAWRYDFRQDFNDPESNTVNFVITNYTAIESQLLTDGVINNASDLSFTNGLLQINFNNTFGVSTNTFNINISADDASTSAAVDSYAFSYEMASTTFTIGDTLTGSQVTSAGNNAIGSASSYTIMGTNNEVYLSNFDDDGTINLFGNGNFINMNNGNDILTVNSGASGNQITGGNHNDTFIIQDVRNEVHGDSGNDIFNVDLENGTAIISDLNAGTNTIMIDGGADAPAQPFFINFNTNTFNGNGDKLSFSSDSGAQGDNIDFTSILASGAQIENMEILAFDNGDNNAITLNHDNVLNMTDNKYTLVIRGDASDTLIFDGQGEIQFGSGQVINDAVSGDTYQTYFIGDVTLLVDTDIATTVSNVV